MAKSNVEIVTTGLEVLLKGLRPYVLRELKAKYGDRWWNVTVRDSLRGTVSTEAKWAQLTDEQRFELLDVQALLTVMNNAWNEVFQEQLGYTGRSYVSEIREVRNSWAHQRAFSAEDAYRALDTIGRLLSMVGVLGPDEIRKLSQDLLRQHFEAETKRELKQSAALTQTGAPGSLKPWRNVATPHPDVASGRYQQAEFAADLFQVITGKAEPEYGDAREFFHRTYLTEGLTRLLSRAWARLAGAGGDPVVEIQTNFGGGSWASLLTPLSGAAAIGKGETGAASIGRCAALAPQLLVHDPAKCPWHKRTAVGFHAMPPTLRAKKSYNLSHKAVHSGAVVAILGIVVEEALTLDLMPREVRCQNLVKVGQYQMFLNVHFPP